MNRIENIGIITYLFVTKKKEYKSAWAKSNFKKSYSNKLKTYCQLDFISLEFKVSFPDIHEKSKGNDGICTQI